MKNWKIIVCLVSLVFFVFAGTACQESGATKTAEFRGALYKNNDGGGLYFRSGGKRYEVESQQDLAGVVGKTVTLQGAVSEKEGKSIIVVNSVKASAE